MEFVTAGMDGGNCITCPYCEYTNTAVDVAHTEVTCGECDRQFALSRSRFRNLTSETQPNEVVEGQHNAYMFGQYAVFSPLVFHGTPRFWGGARWFMLSLFATACLLVYIAPNHTASIVVFIVSMLLTIGLVLIRVFLFGSRRLSEYEKRHVRGAIQYPDAFEEGYADMRDTLSSDGPLDPDDISV